MNLTMSEGPPATATYLSVRIGRTLHAIPIAAIEEVLPALPVEAVSQLPPFVRGVVFVRGHLIPVLDGAERLGLEPRDAALEPQLVCLRINDRFVGLEVDEAIDLVELSLHDRLPVPQLGGGNRFLSSVIDHHGEIMRILDPERLLLHEESSQLEHVSH